jgi:hypothetical protein
MTKHALTLAITLNNAAAYWFLQTALMCALVVGLLQSL